MNIKDIPIRSPLFSYRTLDYSKNEIESTIYLHNPKAKTTGHTTRDSTAVPYLKALGVKVTFNVATQSYKFIGCYANRQYVESAYYKPPVIDPKILELYSSVQLNGHSKIFLPIRDEYAIIEDMRKGITGEVETEAYE